ncbi:hypothetical protein EIP91_004543 [Steccherinum ochraceum]|uniref:Uncharacterized protein n=1 Tax=Steccherinum ochraceum TaxID=92696 RepID=A0A4R0R8M8_9APHY|nr:hypothetical protein EIP91_004543 [Steccherinum ochraceum]
MAYHRSSCAKMSRRADVPKVKCRQTDSKDQVLDSSGDSDSSDGKDSDDDKESSNDSSTKPFGPFPSNSNTNNNNNNNGNGSNNGSSNNGNNQGNNSQQGSNVNKPPNPPPPPPTRTGCQFVNENDGRLQYMGLWTLETKDPYGFTTTTHTTSSIGSQVAVNFNGSMIIVVGIVHPGNLTIPPAVAAYTIDMQSPTVLPLPVATHDIPNQQFFQSSSLTPGEHTLLINVTSDGSPYTLDYLFVCGSGGPPPQSAVKNSDSPMQEVFVSKTVAIIVGSILGALMFTLLCALLAKGRTTHNPLREWLQRQTFFTSSESIMRNNPTHPSAADHKDVTSNPPDDALSIVRKSNPLPPDVPVYRTFAEFDSGFSFPVSYRLSTQISAQVPCSPDAVSGRHDLSPHPALPQSNVSIPSKPTSF